MSNEFHITIGAGAQSNLNLSNDLTMLKAALLYADKITLCSMTATMTILAAQLITLNEDQRIEIVRELAKVRGEVEVFDARMKVYKDLRKKRQRTRQELVLYHTLKSSMDKSWKEANQAIEKMAIEAGVEGLAEAIQTGIVELYPFSTTKTGDMVQEYFEYLKDALLSGSTYPLFDQKTGELIRFSVEEGKIQLTETLIGLGKHAGLSADLLQRLPLFEEATIAEIRDIRRDLAQYLVRFRAAVIEYSQAIRNAAWDKDFPIDANELFHQKVAPEILTIEEAVQSNRYYKVYTRKLTEKHLLPLASMSAVVSTLSGISDLAQTLYGAAAGSVALGISAAQEWDKKKKETEANQLYFYYRARQKLSDK
jgi:hypothetical protein